MSLYATVILALILGDFVIGFVADLLNLRAARSDVPDSMRSACDDASYRKSQEYLRATTRFGFISGTFDLLVLLIFWFSGGFNWLDGCVRAWASGPVWTGLLYIGAISLARTFLGLPFSAYSTFVIEDRFGFNKTTVRTFIADLLKGALLAVLLGGPLLAGILAFFEYCGPSAWLCSWGAVAAFNLFVAFIAPVWILPLFNKFTPLDEGALRDAVLAFADQANFAVQELYVMDGSKRSSKSNAFFTGFGKNRRIALFDTLIEKHSVPELVAVLAHEIGHYKKKHIVTRLAIGIAHAGVLFFLLSLFLTQRGLYDAFYVERMSTHTGLLLFGLLYSPIEAILSAAMQALSRRQEYQADQFVAESGADTHAFVTAIKTLAVQNLSNLTPHPFYVLLHYSHPPVIQRIERMTDCEKKARAPV